ncbi:transposase, partial [Candidatus Aquicultor secundus]
KPRLDAPGLVHHVIARGIERREIFVDDADRRTLFAQISKLAGGDNNHIYAFCLMPNHIHLCVRTLAMPLATFMRRLLTRYAIYFNHRHKRCGHLFQNRYKSFVVDEENYLLELIRYIHLNPVRAGTINGLDALERWPYAGHAALMGRVKLSWFASEHALSLFAGKRSPRERLATFMQEGLERSSNYELSGGGLKRSLKIRERSERAATGAFDERILGASSFVEAVLANIEHPPRDQAPKVSLEELKQIVATVFGLTDAELCSGSRRPTIVSARDALIWYGAQHLGIRAAEIASTLNITPSAVCTALRLKRGKESSERLLM